MNNDLIERIAYRAGLEKALRVVRRLIGDDNTDLALNADEGTSADKPTLHYVVDTLERYVARAATSTAMQGEVGGLREALAYLTLFHESGGHEGDPDIAIRQAKAALAASPPVDQGRIERALTILNDSSMPTPDRVRFARAALTNKGANQPMKPTDRIIYERGFGPGDGDSHVERVEPQPMTQLLIAGQTYQNKRGDYLKIEARADSFLDQYGRQYDAYGVQMGHNHKSTGNVDLATAGTIEGWRDEKDYAQ